MSVDRTVTDAALRADLEAFRAEHPLRWVAYRLAVGFNPLDDLPRFRAHFNWALTGSVDPTARRA